MNMDPGVHYVVQTSAYDRLVVGTALTDKRIEHYRLLGYYGKEQMERQREINNLRRRAKQTKRLNTIDISQLI